MEKQSVYMTSPHIYVWPLCDLEWKYGEQAAPILMNFLD